MTGKPMHTTSKERMVPELTFSSECTLQLSITDLKAKWQPIRYTALQVKNSRRSTSAINPVTMENTNTSHLKT